jgi:pyrroline-5-carboxylate reductase
MKTIGFIGGGRITRILINGFRNASVTFSKIFVCEMNKSVFHALKSDYSSVEKADASQAASADWVFIALHPPVLMETLTAIKSFVKKDALVVSLAPKITIEKIRGILSEVPAIARMNPNAGTYVNKGFNPVCFAGTTDHKTISEFLDVFQKLGKVPVVPENQIEAYAMVSAMGHTYFWFQVQQLKELGLSFGLSDKEANETIAEMLWGTTETLFNSGLPYDKVVDLVPVKPIAEHEEAIKNYYKDKLNCLYQKIKP